MHIHLTSEELEALYTEIENLDIIAVEPKQKERIALIKAALERNKALDFLTEEKLNALDDNPF